VARAGILQQALGVQRLAPGVEMNGDEAIAAVRVLVVVDRLRRADLDRPNRLDERGEHLEVDQHVMLDRDAQLFFDHFGGIGRAAPAGVIDVIADDISCVDAPWLVEAGHVDPQIARDGEQRPGLADRVQRQQDDRVGGESAGFTGALVDAQQQDRHAARVLPRCHRDERFFSRGFGLIRRGVGGLGRRIFFDGGVQRRGQVTSLRCAGSRCQCGSRLAGLAAADLRQLGQFEHAVQLGGAIAHEGVCQQRAADRDGAKHDHPRHHKPLGNAAHRESSTLPGGRIITQKRRAIAALRQT